MISVIALIIEILCFLSMRILMKNFIKVPRYLNDFKVLIGLANYKNIFFCFEHNSFFQKFVLHLLKQTNRFRMSVYITLNDLSSSSDLWDLFR